MKLIESKTLPFQMTVGDASYDKVRNTKVTIKKSGHYKIDLMGNLEIVYAVIPTGWDGGLYLYRNGTLLYSGGNSNCKLLIQASSPMIVSMPRRSFTVYLEEDDYIEMYAYADHSGGNVTTQELIYAQIDVYELDELL